ncbi:MAG: aldo/keto reductase [Gammaproteobacteria bacterium]|nr:MAG: aldo/keto reductase [Gammaproteobacteria bacterium]
MLSPFYRKINQLTLSPIGLGTVKFGRNSGVKYPDAFSLPDDDAVSNLLAQAHALGINILDTAPAYGCSEQRLGQLLKNRHDWIISTKVGEQFNHAQSSFDFSAKAVRASIQRSLTRLRTDYLDIVLIHSDGNDLDILHHHETVNTLKQLQKQGLVRHIGLSGKTIEGGIAALRQYNMDFAMITYNPVQPTERAVIEVAAHLHKGTLVKKAFASGHLDQLGDNPIQTTMDFIFAEPVTSVIVGTINPVHLQENVQAAVQALSADEATG